VSNINQIKNTSLTLLYIEDTPQTRESTTFAFKELFDNIIIAIDGEDGFSKFKENKIDIVITDINMPKLNGIGMIKKIRDIDPDVYIVIISAYNNIEYLTHSIRYQVQEYLFKPIDRKQFKETLHRAKEEIIARKKQKKRISLLEHYKKITDNSAIISKTDINGYITYVNDEFCRISEYSRYEVMGKQHNLIRSSSEPKKIFEELWRTIKNRKKTWHGVMANQTKSGKIFYTKSTIEPILNMRGEVEEFIASRILITDIIHPKKQLIDFLSKVNNSIVVLIKIEDFIYLDMPLERELSEKIQTKFAKTLFNFQTQIYNFSKIYLLENGEFVFAQKGNRPTKALKELIEKLKKFQQQINSAKINIAPLEYDLSIIMSMGYGKNAFENAKIGLENLLRTKQSFIIANELLEEKRTQAIGHIKTFKMLRKAIDSYNIISYFQPIVNNRTKETEKYESLVRVIDENKKILPPSQFLNEAKEGKYYNQITSMVLTNSFQALYETSMSISINFSALDIENKKSREELFRLLEQHKQESHRVTLELLEDERIQDTQLIKEFIKKVKRYNVSIAIDDFGVGYSNFQRVLEYQPDILKIDGSLIKNIEHDNFSLHMVETIVAFAQKQHIKTVAEFVENENIYNILCRLEVDYSQGYYFGKPDIL
jgi:PAS domain S-box-containing protein